MRMQKILASVGCTAVLALGKATPVQDLYTNQFIAAGAK
jgi:hypothetical protein